MNIILKGYIDLICFMFRRFWLKWYWVSAVWFQFPTENICKKWRLQFSIACEEFVASVLCFWQHSIVSKKALFFILAKKENKSVKKLYCKLRFGIFLLLKKGLCKEIDQKIQRILGKFSNFLILQKLLYESFEMKKRKKLTFH